MEVLNSSACSTLFLGDLATNCTEEDIRKAFQHFGNIEAIVIKRGGPDKPNLSYSFLKFSNRAEAEYAQQKMTGFPLLGRPVRLVI